MLISYAYNFMETALLIQVNRMLMYLLVGFTNGCQMYLQLYCTRVSK